MINFGPDTILAHSDHAGRRLIFLLGSLGTTSGTS